MLKKLNTGRVSVRFGIGSLLHFGATHACCRAKIRPRAVLREVRRQARAIGLTGPDGRGTVPEIYSVAESPPLWEASGGTNGVPGCIPPEGREGDLRLLTRQLTPQALCG